VKNQPNYFLPRRNNVKAEDNAEAEDSDTDRKPLSRDPVPKVDGQGRPGKRKVGEHVQRDDAYEERRKRGVAARLAQAEQTLQMMRQQLVAVELFLARLRADILLPPAVEVRASAQHAEPSDDASFSSRTTDHERS
jgi:hypothetical protein